MRAAWVAHRSADPIDRLHERRGRVAPPPFGVLERVGSVAYDGSVEAAFFDLDKTIVSRSSSLALGRPLYRAGMVSRGQLMRGAYAQLVFLLIGADEERMERGRSVCRLLTLQMKRSHSAPPWLLMRSFRTRFRARTTGWKFIILIQIFLLGSVDFT